MTLMNNNYEHDTIGNRGNNRRSNFVDNLGTGNNSDKSFNNNSVDSLVGPPTVFHSNRSSSCSSRPRYHRSAGFSRSAPALLGRNSSNSSSSRFRTNKKRGGKRWWWWWWWRRRWEGERERERESFSSRRRWRRRTSFLIIINNKWQWQSHWKW